MKTHKTSFKYLFFISYILVIFGCNEHTSKIIKTYPPQYSVIKFQDYSGKVFDNVKTTSLNDYEINSLEKILEKIVIENNTKQTIILQKHNLKFPNKKWKTTGFELDLKDKKRQYVAVINNKGEKEIWANVFCDYFNNEKWETEILIVKDGGNCFFNVKINLSKNTYYELKINGSS